MSGVRNVTGRWLRTHRDLGRERAADSTYRRVYLRSARPPGPNRARTGGGPKELWISEQLGILSRQVANDVALQSRTDLRISVSAITEPDMSSEVCAISRGLIKWGARFHRCFHYPQSCAKCVDINSCRYPAGAVRRLSIVESPHPMHTAPRA